MPSAQLRALFSVHKSPSLILYFDLSILFSVGAGAHSGTRNLREGRSSEGSAPRAWAGSAPGDLAAGSARTGLAKSM